MRLEEVTTCMLSFEQWHKQRLINTELPHHYYTNACGLGLSVRYMEVAGVWYKWKGGEWIKCKKPAGL